MEEIEYDYIERTKDLFDVWQDSKYSEDKWLEALIDSRSIIDEISDHVKQTGLFLETVNTDKYNKLLNSIHTARSTSAERLSAAQQHFVDNINHYMHTKAHLRGIIILCIPVLSHFLNLYLDDTKRLQF